MQRGTFGSPCRDTLFVGAKTLVFVRTKAHLAILARRSNLDTTEERVNPDGAAYPQAMLTPR